MKFAGALLTLTLVFSGNCFGQGNANKIHRIPSSAKKDTRSWITVEKAEWNPDQRAIWIEGEAAKKIFDSLDVKIQEEPGRDDGSSTFIKDADGIFCGHKEQRFYCQMGLCGSGIISNRGCDAKISKK